MPLVTTQKMLHDAQEGGYAVGAFNIENMEMAQAVIAAAEHLRTPVIMQTTPSTVRYAGAGLYASIVSSLAADATVPVGLHLDHGSSCASAVVALHAGYTSVMVDGSQLPFEENIDLTVQVVNAVSAWGVPVEGELGCIGGKEDSVTAEASVYTDPELAAEFVSRTGVFSLAVAIGTAHGIYNGTPRLDVHRLTQIRQRVNAPLVLHGASGLPAETVRHCIREGICKVNFATELRIAYTEGVKAYLFAHPDAFDPKTYGKAGYDRVKAAVEEKILMVHDVK